MKGLTEKQAHILAFIDGFIRKEGEAPTLRELALAFGIRENAANQHVKALVRKGYIERDKGRWRSIHMIKREA